MNASMLLGLYPRTWRRRYGDEVAVLLDDSPPGIRVGADLVRGALDAWLHPPSPSRVPVVAALAGGGLWTVVAAATVFQPVPLDWPGYLADTLALALLAVVTLLVATIGCAVRIADERQRTTIVVTAVAIAGYLAWIVALAGALAGLSDAPTVAAAQTVALAGTAFVGILLVRAGDQWIGVLLLGGSTAMIIPWTPTWLAFGAAWTAVGLALAVGRARIVPDPWLRP